MQTKEEFLKEINSYQEHAVMTPAEIAVRVALEILENVYDISGRLKVIEKEKAEKKNESS